MKPYQVTFSLYAEDDREVKDLQCTLYDFVSNLYEDGVYVRATRLTQYLKQYGNSPFLKQLLK